MRVDRRALLGALGLGAAGAAAHAAAQELTPPPAPASILADRIAAIGICC